MNGLDISEIIKFLLNLINPEWILNNGGVWLLIFVVFAETGLFLGFFFPGDSLLFVTGMVLSKTNLILFDGVEFNLYASMIIIMIAAILGNFAGYWFGEKSGNHLFKKKDTLLFKKRHLYQAKEFYEKRGQATIIIARFLPIVRTFVPIVAGVVKMEYKRFVAYNIIGSICWVTSMILTGYFLGRIFPTLKSHLELIVLFIVLITTLPVLYKIWRHKKKYKKNHN